MINRIFKSIFAAPLIILLVIILFVNARLYHTPEMKAIGTDTINLDLLSELRGVKHALNNDADVKMQGLFPEGFVFMNALYGLAWCNFIEHMDPGSNYFDEGTTEIKKACDKVNSPRGQARFYSNLPIPYGAFYAGWSAYLLGKKLGLEKTELRDTAEVNHFKRQCLQISRTIQEQPFPESYHLSAWPADAVICVAALSLHDKLYLVSYKSVIAGWIKQAKARLDDEGLIPHAVEVPTGKALTNARGSSQSLMLLFLSEIDKTFADSQFRIYKRNFLDARFGLYGVREYPKERSGAGDVDSGPVILGMGAAATIVGMGTLSRFNENNTGIKNTIEGLGLSFKTDDRKTYLLGMLPMADAFICWAHSQDSSLTSNSSSFIIFHLYSVVVVLLLGLWIYYILRPKKARN